MKQLLVLILLSILTLNSSESISQRDTICLKTSTFQKIAADLEALDGCRREVNIQNLIILDLEQKYFNQVQISARKDSIKDLYKESAIEQINENIGLKADNKKVKTQRNVLGGALGVIIIILIAL